MRAPTRHRGRSRYPTRSRNAGAASSASSSTFNPLTGWTTDPVHGVWASDPLWVPPADGGAVSRWRNGGSAYTTGAYIGADGLVLQGVAGNYGYLAPAAVLNPAGDMEFVCRVTPTDWTPASIRSIMTNGDHSGPAYHNWYLWLNTTGTLMFSRPSGSTARVFTSTVATGVTDGTPKWVKVTFDQDNGSAQSEVRFYLSDDGSSWTQLGDPVTNASTGAGNNNTVHGSPTIGQSTYGSLYRWDGTIHRVIVKSGIDGTTVLDADFSSATEGVSSFVESSSNAATVSIISTQNPAQATGSKQPTYDASLAAFNNQPVVTFATDDVLAVDVADIAQPYYLVVVGATAGGSGVERLVGIGTNTGYGLGDDGTPDWTFSAGTAIAGGTPDANPHLFRATANGASSALLVDETSVVASNAGATGLTVLALGAGVSTLGTYANYLNGSIAYAAVFTTDPTAQSEWATFKAWVASTYGITVA